MLLSAKIIRVGQSATSENPFSTSEMISQKTQ
jgi:hypothetical protein